MRTWTVEELHLRLASLDPQMEQEIEEIRQRYQAKRQPILDAIEAKKRRQQNFWERPAVLCMATHNIFSFATTMWNVSKAAEVSQKSSSKIVLE